MSDKNPLDELRKQMPKPEDWDPRPEEVIASERKLTDYGSVKIVSLWWSEPHVIGVLSDGRRLIVSTPTHHPTEATQGRMGDPGVRDPNARCELFCPGTPQGRGECLGDGHYLCQECEMWTPEEES